MKKMGEMQLSSVTDSKKKKTILDQVTVPLCLELANLLGLYCFVLFFLSRNLERSSLTVAAACHPDC